MDCGRQTGAEQTTVERLACLHCIAEGGQRGRQWHTQPPGPGASQDACTTTPPTQCSLRKLSALRNLHQGLKCAYNNRKSLFTIFPHCFRKCFLFSFTKFRPYKILDQPCLKYREDTINALAKKKKKDQIFVRKTVYYFRKGKNL